MILPEMSAPRGWRNHFLLVGMLVGTEMCLRRIVIPEA
jgi:hypothetical protein